MKKFTMSLFSVCIITYGGDTMEKNSVNDECYAYQSAVKAFKNDGDEERFVETLASKLLLHCFVEDKSRELVRNFNISFFEDVCSEEKDAKSCKIAARLHINSYIEDKKNEMNRIMDDNTSDIEQYYLDLIVDDLDAAIEDLMIACDYGGDKESCEGVEKVRRLRDKEAKRVGYKEKE